VVSLDGFMANDHDEVGPLFDWYGNGDVAWSFPGSDGESRSTQASADFMRSHYRNMATVVAAAACRPSRLAQLDRPRAEACDALHLSVARWAEVDHGSTRREPAGSLEMPRPSAIM
jgi:hypothetical protein